MPRRMRILWQACEGLSKDACPGRNSELDHDQTQKGLHGIDTDLHPFGDLFTCQSLKKKAWLAGDAELTAGCFNPSAIFSLPRLPS